MLLARGDDCLSSEAISVTRTLTHLRVKSPAELWPVGLWIKFAFCSFRITADKHSTVCSWNYIVSQKVGLYPLMFDFGKCGPIFNMFSPLDSYENSLCVHHVHHKDFHNRCSRPMLLHYGTLWKLKIQICCWFWQHPQQTVDMFLRTLWGLDLTVVRQTVSRLLTNWLTFWSLSDDVLNQQLNVVQLTLVHRAS